MKYIKKKTISNRLFIVGLAAFLPFSSLAQAAPYFGINTGYTFTEQKNSDDLSWNKSSPLLIQAQVGYFFSDYIAFEGRYAVSAKRDEGFAVNELASVFLKGNVPVTERVAMYALAGVSEVSIDNASGEKYSEQGSSFGVGVHYALDSNKALTFEFIDYVNGDKNRLNSAQVGFQFKF